MTQFARRYKDQIILIGTMCVCLGLFAWFHDAYYGFAQWFSDTMQGEARLFICGMEG